MGDQRESILLNKTMYLRIENARSRKRKKKNTFGAKITLRLVFLLAYVYTYKIPVSCCKHSWTPVF